MNFYFRLVLAVAAIRSAWVGTLMWSMERKPSVSVFSDMSKLEASAFFHFISECEANGLVARPKHISLDDLCDGINDDVPLL